MAALGNPACADWKVATVYTHDAGGRHIVSNVTEYFKNGMQRSDVIDPALGSRLNFIHVMDSPRTRIIEWSLERREYSVRRLHSTEPSNESGLPIVVEILTTDTGERRTMFGREAHFLVTIERRHFGEDGPAYFESHTNGWYIDSQTMPPQLRESGTDVLNSRLAGGALPPIKIEHHGVIRTGLAVSTERATFWNKAGGERSVSNDTSKVMELFEGQLDPALFQPPPGFTRVYPSYVTVTWHDKMLFCWDWLQDRLGLQ